MYEFYIVSVTHTYIKRKREKLQGRESIDAMWAGCLDLVSGEAKAAERRQHVMKESRAERDVAPD